MHFNPLSISNTITTYLNQWLKVASGGRVVISRHTNGFTHSFTVFECNHCKDNWHVGDENFKNAGIPEVLQDWVKKHRHVCQNFIPQEGATTTGACVKCNWPYGAHEQSWLDTAPAYTTPKPVIVPKEIAIIKSVPSWEKAKYWSGTNITTDKPAPSWHAGYKPQPLPQHKGRKFRDDDNEGV